jgi:hypothetical protein
MGISQRGFQRLALFLAVALFGLIAVGYWYVYGRQHELMKVTTQSDMKSLKKPFTDEWTAQDFKARLFSFADPVRGRLGLVPDANGAVLSGTIISEKENWIINRVRVHVRITETRHCGEKLQNPFTDVEWDKHCAENPNYSVKDTVDGQGYECFVGALAYLQEADCRAKTLLPFDPAKQQFNFFFFSVIGHRQDPLGVFK